MDYMLQTWNLNVTDPGQPLILSKPKAKDLKRGDVQSVLLIPEFCIMTGKKKHCNKLATTNIYYVGLDDASRSNFHTMQAIAQFTRVDPGKRVSKLVDFLRRINT